MNESPLSSWSSALWRLASASRATHSVAVANATLWPARQAPRPPPSAGGTGARAPRSSSCRDQGGVAGQWPQRNVDLARPTALAAEAVELRLVARIGEGQRARKRAPVATGELAGVER